MKIAIYSPYLDTLGGGEKYMMTIAETLSSKHKVEVLLDQHLKDLGGESLKDKLSKRFNLNLDTVNFVEAPIGKNSSSISRIFFLKNYDVFFCLTDGSIFFPTAKRNILHIQSPIVGQPAKNAWGKLKLKGWDLIIYNSEFTKQFSNKNWPLKSDVIYPPVDVLKMNKFFASQTKPLKKEKYILSVGRFFGYLRDKKHELLIKSFRSLFETGEYKEWSLHLVGSAGEGDKIYLEELKKLAKDIPVKFYPNLGYDNLVKLYGQSSIYWHAAGFGEDDPTKMEHFGISTVEAMAAGAIPVVIAKGGQKEIVEHAKSGYLWDTLENLKEFTVKLIKDNDLRQSMRKDAIERSKNFSKEKFKEKITEVTEK